MGRGSERWRDVRRKQREELVQSRGCGEVWFSCTTGVLCLISRGGKSQVPGSEVWITAGYSLSTSLPPSLSLPLFLFLSQWPVLVKAFRALLPWALSKTSPPTLSSLFRAGPTWSAQLKQPRSRGRRNTMPFPHIQ